jgi:hypothetical protein
MTSGSDGGEQLAFACLKVFAQGAKTPVAGEGLDHMQRQAAANGILSRSAPEGVQTYPAQVDPLAGLTQGFVGRLPAERAGGGVLAREQHFAGLGRMAVD